MTQSFPPPTSALSPNEATKLLAKLFATGLDGRTTFGASRAAIHPDARYSLFGPSGDKEELRGREAIFDFMTGAAAALSDRGDEIVALLPIGEQCALLHGRAWRRSRSTGEETRYEYAMLYRVENSLITYAADMLDADAQQFWGRICGSRPEETR